MQKKVLENKMDPLEIIPFTNRCSASTMVPGSKSISNRAFILAAMCEAKINLEGMLISEDVNLMKEALISLGVRIEAGKQENDLVVYGCGGDLPIKEQEIFVGNAGTVARFLTALLSTQNGGVYKLDGTEAMRKRPMVELISSLEKHGCSFEFLNEYGCFPFIMRTKGLRGNFWEVDARKSSQVLSALLMIAPLINEKTTIQYSGGTVSKPFVNLTLEMMKSFSSEPGMDFKSKEEEVLVTCQGYRRRELTYSVEADATASSYFLTLPLVVEGSCTVQGISRKMYQGDSKYTEVIEKLGVKILEDKHGITAIFSGNREGGDFNFNAISDTFLSLAAVSPLLSGFLKISGIAHTRKQETDRVKAMGIELGKLGQKVVETEDSLTIYPDFGNLQTIAEKDVYIDTYHDHRFAMSFAILGSFNLLGNGKPWLSINNPMCCAKTFPEFFDRLNEVREQSVE